MSASPMTQFVDEPIGWMTGLCLLTFVVGLLIGRHQFFKTCWLHLAVYLILAGIAGFEPWHDWSLSRKTWQLLIIFQLGVLTGGFSLIMWFAQIAYYCIGCVSMMNGGAVKVASVNNADTT